MSFYDVNLSGAYEQGIEEGCRQILADIARIYKDNEYPEDKEMEIGEYLEAEGYL